MWEVKIIQSYYDNDGEWSGSGYPIMLDSKFGDTEGVLTEIVSFLKEQGDEAPLEVDAEAVDAFWDTARQDPRHDYELTLRVDDYEPTGQEDDEDFEGVVRIELWLTYNLEESAQAKQPEPEPEPEPEQISFF